MPIIRNPFARRGAPVVSDDNYRTDGAAGAKFLAPGFERVETTGSMASSSALSIQSRRSLDTGEYKMSVVNDSGVYLPPSPTEDKSVWPRRYLSSRTSSETKSSLSDIEHFSISRESFDSYRRSFDISARSPIASSDLPSRQSTDSGRFARRPRTALADRWAITDLEPATDEENFEDVGLEDQLSKPAPRKRGFFAKFGETNPPDEANNHGVGAPAPPTGSVSRFLIPGRRRAHSQSKEMGAELGFITGKPGTEMVEMAQEAH